MRLFPIWIAALWFLLSGVARAAGAPAAAREIIVTSPVGRSELAPSRDRSSSSTTDESSSVGLGAAHWSALPTEAQRSSAPLLSASARIPLADTNAGPLSLELGARYAGFKRESQLSTASVTARGEQMLHWLGVAAGPRLALSALSPGRGAQFGLSALVTPGLLSAPESLAGSTVNRFVLPIEPALDFCWFPSRALPIAIEARAFATLPISGGMSGYGAGAGLRFAPSRGDL